MAILSTLKAIDEDGILWKKLVKRTTNFQLSFTDSGFHLSKEHSRQIAGIAAKE